MSKKILFCSGEGIGNVVQCIPVIRTIKERLGLEVDMWHAFGGFQIPKIIPYVDRWFIGGHIRNLDANDYLGKVSTLWTRNMLNTGSLVFIPILLNTIKDLSMTRSEVDTYMDMARDLGVKEEDLIWHGECLYSNVSEDDRYDVIIHDGYNRQGSANWSIKSYPYYEKVAEKLTESGLRVCSIGSKDERVNGTDDMTGFDLLTTFGLVKKCKVLLSNDSGVYHAANAMGVKNVVIFTATSIEKNFDSRFHKFTTIIGRDDLECRPCQAGRRWSRDCKTWDCRELDPNTVYNAVKERLNGD